jgi:hypothetical protein
VHKRPLTLLAVSESDIEHLERMRFSDEGKRRYIPLSASMQRDNDPVLIFDAIFGVLKVF